MSYLRWLVRTRRHPSAILLLVQLVGMVLYPFMESTDAGRIAFGVFGIVMLVLQAMFGMPQLLVVSSALEALFYFYAAGSLISYMLEDRRATTDELFAAGATFTLLAWGFTYLFLLLQALQPGCFTAAVNPAEPRTWTELMYMSFALLSSTGIGDVIPITPHARALAALEMFVGVMYLAAVVSRLIWLTLQEQRDHDGRR